MDKILNYAEKHGRTEFAVKSKIQKIKQGHQASLESELDRLFLKGKQAGDPVKILPAPMMTPHKVRNITEPVEMKEYLKDFLRVYAHNGIESSELRQRVPKQLIDSENLARIIGELEKDKKIRVQNLPALHLDPNELHTFDDEVLEDIKMTLKRRYKTSLVEGNYPLDILFEDKQLMKERVVMTQFSNIATMTYIFWVD